MINVIIVDDHAVLRKGIKQMLELSGEITVIHELSSGNSAIEYFRDNKEHDFNAMENLIVLLDISMPDRSGPDVMKHLLAYYPKLKIIFVSTHEESQFAINLIKSGAKGYISKSADIDIYTSAVTKVNSGKRYFSEDIAQLLIEQEPDGDDNVLTPRETQIMNMFSEGMTPNEVASKLIIGLKTVLAHRDNIKKKLKIENNAKLIKFAVQNHSPKVN